MAACIAMFLWIQGCESLPTSVGPPVPGKLELRIGAIDDSLYQLTPVSGLAVDDNGNIYIAQPQTSQVKVFSENGRFSAIIGRRGAGPAEFVAPAAIGWLEGKLWVVDPANGRTLVLSEDGTPVRTLRAGTTADDNGIGVSYKMPVVGGILRVPRGRALTGTQGLAVPWILERRGGSSLDTLFNVRLLPRDFLVFEVDMGTLHIAPPISDVPLVALDPSGHGAWLVDRRVDAKHEAGGIARYISTAGDTTVEVALQLPNGPVDQAVIDNALEAVKLESERGAPFRPQDIRREMWVPSAMPAVDRAVAVDSTALWVRIPSSDDVQSWLFVNASPASEPFLGGVPTDLRVLHADRDALWGVERDSLDVPYLVKYVFQRPGAGDQ